MTNDEVRTASAAAHDSLPLRRCIDFAHVAAHRASDLVIPSSFVLRHSSLWLLAFLFLPQSLLACAACFGASDSNQAKGMNMGIFALLAVVVIVLGGIASFFIYLARRANAQAAPANNLHQIS